MNYSSAVMLINENIRAVSVSFKQDSNGDPVQCYTYKTLDKTIKKGDFVVVPTKDKNYYMTVCRVEDVDVDIDFESNIELKWIHDKVDLVAINAIMAEEQKWITQLKLAEKRKKREDIKKNMLDMYADEDFKVDALPIANMAGTEDATAAIESKATPDDIRVEAGAG